MEAEIFFFYFLTAIISIIFYFLKCISLWKIFKKANEPGWYSIIPLLDIIMWLKIIGRPILWIVYFMGIYIILYLAVFSLLKSLSLSLIAFIGSSVLFWILSTELALSFGKTKTYGAGIFFLPFIFLPILAFSDAKYEGPVHLAEQEEILGDNIDSIDENQ